MGSFIARSAGAGLALCIGALCANSALAQGQRPVTAGGRLGEMLLGAARKPTTPPVARYAAEDSVAFILDLSTPQPLLRFDGSEEIWVLFPHQAPGNDTVYKNDVGETVLRASRLGGVTVFTTARPYGAAAQFKGGGPSLQLRSLMGAVLVGKRLQAASVRLSRAANRLVQMDAPDIGPESAAVAVDAAVVAAETFERLSRGERNLAALARISQVVLLEGEKASVQVSRRSLIITVVPGRGFAGRPSSAKIAKALKG